MARLGDVCTKASSNIAQKDIDFDSGIYPIYGASGLITTVDFYKMDKPYIAVVKDGAGVGRIMKLPAKSSVIGTMQYIIPNESVDKDYLSYAMEHMNLSKYYSGATIPHIYFKDYEKEIVNLVSIEKQKEISNVLNKISDLISQRKQQLSKLDELVKSRFVELFGDPEANPHRLKICKLADYCDLQNGYAFKSQDYLDSSDVLNCRMSNIRPDGGFDAEYHPKYLPSSFWEKYSEYRLFDGDVIIAMTDMASDPKILGVPTIVKTGGKKFLLNQRVGKLTFLKENLISNVYLMFVLSQPHIRKQLVQKAGGSTQINVGKPAVLSVEFFEPPIELQNEFAAFVEQTDKLKLTAIQSLERLETLKKSLMQKYFG